MKNIFPSKIAEEGSRLNMNYTYRYRINGIFKIILECLLIVFLMFIFSVDSLANVGNDTMTVNQESDSSSYWIESVDTDSEDDSNKTDMTDAIKEKLEDYGYCHLGPGIFYVRGNIDMPYGSTLEGCGQNTIIRMISNSPCDYIIKPIRRSTIKNLTLSGGYEVPDLSSSEIGNKCGISFMANADGQEYDLPGVLTCTIDKLWIENFEGSGIYCHNTGGGLRESLTVNDCYIEYCKAGINIDYYSEYHRFTDTKVFRCHYACINNGGNNVFSSCTFHGTLGFLIDNSDGLSRNNAHGTAIGCTFNHIDNWNNPSGSGASGEAIVVNNSNTGFIFTGCQIWYGQISINDAKGIAFSDCMLGGNTPIINVSGKEAVYFNDCLFHQYPELNINCSSRLNNCYCVLLEKEIDNPVSHKYIDKIINKSTCNKTGLLEKRCLVCNEKLEVSIPVSGHIYSEWKIRKAATETRTGIKERVCKNCNAIEQQIIAKLTPSVTTIIPNEISPSNPVAVSSVDRQITSVKSDTDPRGSVFNILQAKGTTKSKTSIKITWKKVSGASAYIIYGNKCGIRNRFKKLSTVIDTSFTQKKLKKGSYYKYIVVAVNGEKALATSRVIHVATKGGKVGNYKSITTKAKKNNVFLKKGRTFKLGAKANAQGKTFKVKKHRKLAFESNNKNIATVSSNGLIKAVGKGRCTVFVYTQNGICKKIKITVR